jgi:hypothetical protein
MKKKLKLKLIDIFIRLLGQNDVNNALVKAHFDYGQQLIRFKNLENPYTNISLPFNNKGDGVVFVTGRFRSGSTLLWNVFRESGEFTSFYEPFNERRWFDAQTRGETVDKTHRGVKDYWREYDQLQELDEFYDERWIDNALYMSDKVYQPKMRAFIDTIIERSPKRPVLQFNRVDFRLPWLRKQYPNAKIVHLYRNPRDQWCSFLMDKELMNKYDVETAYIDNFYLDVWARDLSQHFPFLNKQITPHPYKRFYYLWKLSYLFGVEYSDISISYEDLVTDTRVVVEKLRLQLDAETSLVDDAEAMISKTSVGTWTNYADESWFSCMEKACEETINGFLLSS